MKKKFLTLQGKKRIEIELNRLITSEREHLKKIIAHARALGDLKENAEYHSAKEKQGLLEGRIAQLQGALAHSQVIDTSKVQSEVIVFGATVTLQDIDNKTITYKIVGQEESNTKEGRISIESPLGQALIGKEEGDTVVVKAPKGDIEYEVQEITYK